MGRKAIYQILIIFSMFPMACQNSPTPKPRGFPRVEFAAKEYRVFDSLCPYRFEHPVYSRVIPDTDKISEPCWINIEFPDFDGMIHISYKNVENNLYDFIEDSRSLTYKHSIKADAIRETVYTDPEMQVHGVLYDIKGNTASSLQFYLTDSLRHFLRGSLYFNVEPNKDSLAPVIAYFKEDIVHLMETFEWK
jgi:gliding motility-associated lipoprotein GldD